MDVSNKKSRGYTGLMNLGNTCFMNSCIQIISHTYELHPILFNTTLNKNSLDGLLFKEFQDLLHIMWKENCIVSPNKFLSVTFQVALKKNKETFAGYNQNDLSEFLLFILDSLHNSISRSVDARITGKPENTIDEIAINCYSFMKKTYEREYSEMMDIFYGIYVSEIKSKEGLIHSMTPEHFFTLDLSVSIDDNNIYDCLNNFVQHESLTGENAWYNEKTKMKEEVEKRYMFWSFPKVLVLVLKRFSSNGKKKIKKQIDFPIHGLNLSKYVIGYNPQSYIYDLYGVANHTGNIEGGHYTSFVKTADNQWIHFNDSNLSKIGESNIVTNMSYCLFYRKKNNLL